MFSNKTSRYLSIPLLAHKKKKIELLINKHLFFFVLSTKNPSLDKAIYMTNRFDGTDVFVIEFSLFSLSLFPSPALLFSFSGTNFFSIIMSINHMVDWEHRLAYNGLQLVVSMLIWVQFSMITSICKCPYGSLYRAKDKTINDASATFTPTQHTKRTRKKETNDKIFSPPLVLLLFLLYVAISWKSRSREREREKKNIS